MTMTTASVVRRAHDGVVDADPADRPRRRSFTAEYKARILDEYDAIPAGSEGRGRCCDARGCTRRIWPSGARPATPGSAIEVEGSLSPGTRVRVASSPDKAGTGQHRQMVWVRRARREGVTAVNQRMNASQEQTTSRNLTDGWVVARTRTIVRGTPGPVDVAGREATRKACGVLVARPQGHSWAPHLSSGSRVNVGTTLVAPFPASGQLVGGKARRRLLPLGWGGGPVVVRGRESRAHGEGVQQVCSDRAERGDRR